MFRLLSRITPLQPRTTRLYHSSTSPRPSKPRYPPRGHVPTLLRSNATLRLGESRRLMETTVSMLPAAAMNFHSTRRNEGLPFIPIMALLKASTALEMARTAGRIALTFIPVLLLKNHGSRKLLRHVEQAKKQNPDGPLPYGLDKMWKKKTDVLRRIRQRTILFHALLAMPFLLFSAAILASLERTPLTGRWRMILLSPHEEDEISSQLAGSGWYQAVGEVIAKDGPVKLIPPSDWRFAWVRDTLRHLETAIPLLADEASLGTAWLERGPDDIPLPPPTDHPLRARPTEAEVLRWCSQMVCYRSAATVVAPISPHRIPGPPYSLIVVDDPESCNAFSFGFGPDGAGGIVVYSGFLDSILRNVPAAELRTTSADEPQSEEGSWWSYLFGSFATVHPPVQRYHPTPEQTSELAMLLAHELSHLILAHHIENLSSRMVVLPGTLSLLGDVLRALVFPFTMIFGPFVNDAVAEMGSAISMEKLVKLGEVCTTRTQEIEADVVSARLLAHAGFDARCAVDFWERKHNVDSELTECTPRRPNDESLAMRLVGAGHPVQDQRIQKLREELNRWQEERMATLAALADQAQKEQEQEQVAAAADAAAS